MTSWCSSVVAVVTVVTVVTVVAGVAVVAVVIVLFCFNQLFIYRYMRPKGRGSGAAAALRQTAANTIYKNLPIPDRCYLR